MSETETLSKSQLQYRRSKGVSKAWERERELVRKGRGTREWTVAEQKQLLKTGRVKGYQGHHMKSVAKHPEYADDPKNIQFLDARKGNNEHLKAHKGDYRNESDGRFNVKTEKIRPMSEGKPRAMNSYELKNKAIEKRGYTKYAADAKGSEKSAMKNKSSAKKNTSAKSETTYKGETYKRTLAKSSGKAKTQSNTTAKTSKSSPVKAKASSNAKTKAGSTQKYGAKTKGASSRPAKKTSSSYGSKMKAGSTSSGAKKGSSYSKAASGKGKAPSGGRAHSAGGKSHGSGGQHR